MSSVRVVLPDWRAVFSSLEAWARGLVRDDPAVLGVLLYGSLARGDYAPGSDADLLVVLHESPQQPAERSGLLAPLRLPICYDVVVYTEEELTRLLARSLPFLRRVLSEGRWLSRRVGWEAPLLDHGQAGAV